MIHKDVLSQADILVAMKLTVSQDRDAIGGWIEGQADRIEGKRILGELPRLGRGEGYLWAPGHDVLARVAFPTISTFDSSRTPRRGERVSTPRTLAEVDLSAITAALAATEVPGAERPSNAGGRPSRHGALKQHARARDQELAQLHARITELETSLADAERAGAVLRERLARIGQIATDVVSAESVVARPAAPSPSSGAGLSEPISAVAKRERAPRTEGVRLASAAPASDTGLHPAARKLLAALAQHAPARFTWSQVATLAGLKPAGGHYNAGRKQLRVLGLIDEVADLVAANATGLEAAGEVPPAPSTSAERLSLWCERLPSPAPEMLRALAAQGEHHTEVADLAAALRKKPTGGHWNSGIALLRNNGLVEVDGKRLRVSELFR